MKNHKVVEMGSYGKFSYPDIISSGGLGPCIAIGLYDHNYKIGYMMHEVMFTMVDLDSIFNGIVTECRGNSSLEVCVTGGSIDLENNLSISSEELNEEIKSIDSCKSYVNSLVNKYFDKNKINFYYSEPNTFAELCLDTSNGRFYVEKGYLYSLFNHLK